jgi:hypothetical protein
MHAVAYIDQGVFRQWHSYHTTALMEASDYTCSQYTGPIYNIHNDHHRPKLTPRSLDPAVIVEPSHPQTVASSLEIPVATCKQSWASPLRCVAGCLWRLLWQRPPFPSERLPVSAPTSRPHACTRAGAHGLRVYDEVLTAASYTPPARNKCRSTTRPDNIHVLCLSLRIT